MVLSKRTRDGEYVNWAPAGQATGSDVTLNMATEPKQKKARKNPPTPYVPPASTATPYLAPPMKVPTKTGSSKVIPASTSSHSTTVTGTCTPGPSQVQKVSKARKVVDSGAPKPEKRGAIFKKSCPKNILERVDRVMSQRFFMIDRRRVAGELKEIFSVLGSTGNVYTVTIDHKPSCNCPDAVKGNHCKHILFIYLKVLQVSQASGFWYQKALLTSELETIFAEAPLAPNSVANPRIQEAHARATGKSKATSQPSMKKRVPGPDDDCPICYDGMHGVGETSLIFCEDCGNALHKECFQQWQTRSAKDGKDLTCVWCRARWVFASAASANSSSTGATITHEGYLNLGNVSGVSPVRDTSTYYHGPRRGHRYYGYQDYLD